MPAPVDIIFLDIDGVLLPFGEDTEVKSECGAIFPDSTMAALDHLLSSSGASLVLSSTWRARSDFVAQILDSFRKYGSAHGSGGVARVNEFYSVTDLNYHGERQWEIYGWLQQHQVRAWVALDDEDLVEGYENSRYRQDFLGRAILVDSKLGLTMQDSHRAVSLMKTQVDNYAAT